jgi:WD40 repeat protein/transcriptional regulator with XRE-family HTH domain
MSATSLSIALDRFTTFGDLLKYLRRRAGYTQRELSIAVGYSDTQISRLEQNERLPDLATLTARFLPALHLEDQPEAARRLLELAAAVRREDAPASGLPPYKGLRCFDESDAEWFYGRERLTELLVETLIGLAESEQRFLAIVGASGSGKSSVVRAGLTPALRWRPGSSGWPIITLTPGAHPLESLAAGLSGEARMRAPARKLADELASRPEKLSETLEKLCKLANAAHAVLVVDQFEELFTLCRSEREQAAFIEALTLAAATAGGVAVVVIVLRADFYAQCARFDSLRLALARRQEYIGSMTGEEMRRAIEEPARRGHWELEAGLVDLLLQDLGAGLGRGGELKHSPEPGALPLLSHALHSTWLRRRGRTLTFSGYTASGGVRGAIAETAEAVFYDHLEPEQRIIARQIFLRLTELGGSEAADTRRRVSFAELISRPEEAEAVQEVLHALADARLIITDQETAEVAHEALIREWPTLRAWLEEDREGLRLQRQLSSAAQDWDALGREPDALYRGARLAQALEWVSSQPAERLEPLSLLERQFLEASQALEASEAGEREARRQRELEAAQRLAEIERLRAGEQALASRRNRRLALTLGAALCAAALLAVITLLLGQRAVQAGRLAFSRELAAAAANNLSIDPERSILLALEALQQADTLEARNALHQALPELHLLKTIQAHPGGVPQVVFSPDGSRFASLGAINEAIVWDAASGEPLLRLNNGLGDEMSEGGSGLEFSPDGRLLAGAWGTLVIIWDAASGQELYRLSGESAGTLTGYNLGVGQVSFSPDSQKLALPNLDGLPRVWDLERDEIVLTLPNELLPPKAIAYSQDGKLLATGGDEGLVKIWDAANGAEQHSLALGGVIHSLGFEPGGSRLAASSEDGAVKIWEAGSGEELLSLPRQVGSYDIAFLPGGRIAVAGQDGVTRIYDAASGTLLLALAGHASTVVSVAGSPDGAQILTGGYDGALRLWETRPGRELLTLPAHQAVAWDMAYSPDGSRMASASVDGTIKLWDAQSGELLQTLEDPAAPQTAIGFNSLAFHPDGRLVAGGSLSGPVLVWDSRSGKLLQRLEGHTNMVTALAFSPDGSRLASASWDSTARTWETAGRPEGWKELATFTRHPAGSLLMGLAFSPDGKEVITGGFTSVLRWDAASGEQLAAYTAQGKEIYGAALSPDGALLAAGDQDGTIHLFSLETGQELKTLHGHAGLVSRLVFTRDGKRLASSSFDRLAKIWDVQSGQELASLYGNLSNVFAAAFSPDGSRLATVGADGSLRVFLLDLEDLVALAQSRLQRRLTQAECQKFLHLEVCPVDGAIETAGK